MRHPANRAPFTCMQRYSYMHRHVHRVGGIYAHRGSSGPPTDICGGWSADSSKKRAFDIVVGVFLSAVNAPTGVPQTREASDGSKRAGTSLCAHKTFTNGWPIFGHST